MKKLLTLAALLCAASANAGWFEDLGFVLLGEADFTAIYHTLAEYEWKSVNELSIWFSGYQEAIDFCSRVEGRV